MTRALELLADAAGVDPAYKSWRGDAAVASDEALIATLRALAPDLGIELAGPDDAEAALVALRAVQAREVVPPVIVAWGGALAVPFAVPADRDAAWAIELVLETGRVVRGEGTLFTLAADSHATTADGVRCVRRARAVIDEPGYHALRWRVGAASGEALVIAAPERAFGGPGDGPRRWGVFAPVYGLASAASGQAGDLRSLGALFGLVGRRGGRYVATLPILAQFLDEPCQFSPYSPASRLFWNELYLDLAGLAAELGMEAPVAAPIVPGAPIDYRSHYRLRRHALDPMAERLFATRGSELDAWAAATGAWDYAAFRAFGEQTRVGWQRWPAAWRDGAPVIASRADAIALGAEAARVTTHVAAQWAMQRQLEALAGGAVGLYLDLPVGVSSDAYEVWRHRGLFLQTLSAGAPPDALFLGGQSWGLPPLSPSGLRRDRYRYFARCLRHHMRVSGMLRIDHVMGLFRLYCVAEGRPATDGVYLRYPYDELLAVVTLESNRARCAVAGEDLGTVPDGVRPRMARHGLFRLHVGQWSFPAAPGEPMGEAPAESIASLNTHDTPTFAGWWRGADIDDRLDLGLITAAQEVDERVARDRSKAGLLAFATSVAPPGGLTDAERAMVAATADLAASPAEVMLIALDDLGFDPVPHNVPGTVSPQRPNWQRRVEGWADILDEDRASEAARAAVAAVVAARPSRD